MESALQRDRLLNCGLIITQWRPSEGVLALRRLKQDDPKEDPSQSNWEDTWNVIKDLDDVANHAYRKMFGPQHAVLNYLTEPKPDPNGRVTLGAERDVFNQNRIQVRWRVSEMGGRTLNRMHQIFAAEVGRANLG